MDKYDEAIAYLIEHPDEVLAAWGALRTPASCLFQYCTPTGAKSDHFGCLTQVKALPAHPAFTPELTAAIRADNRLPRNGWGIKPTLEGLTPFAEWQREMDRTIRVNIQQEFN